MNKKGAIELSVGTIVIIVLAMSMLILGLVLVRSIFSSSTDYVKNIDDKVKNQINQLFSEDDMKKVVVYPSTKIIKLKQGSTGTGFAFAIRNLESNDGVFTYTVDISDDNIQEKCNGLTASSAENWITVGGSGSVTLAPGNSNVDNAEIVRFDLPVTAPTCTMRFAVTVKKDGKAYAQDKMDLQVLPG